MKKQIVSRRLRGCRGALWLVPAAFSLGGPATAAPVAFEPIDALYTPRAVASAAPATATTVPAGYRASFQKNLGLPEFLKATAAAPNRAGSMLLVADAAPIARTYLKALASSYRVSAAEIDALDAFDQQRLPNGAAIVRFENRVDGIEVFRDGFNVLIRADGSLDTVSGFASGAAGPAAQRGFARSAEEAIASALQRDFNFAPASFTLGDQRGAYSYYTTAQTGARGERLLQPARVKPVYFRLPDGLVAAHYVELDVATEEGERYYSYVVSARDGSLLFRNNLTADLQPFNYRVWADTTAPFVPYAGPQGRNGSPHPTGEPDGYQAPMTAPNLVSLVNAITNPASVAAGDPWLDDTATETVGNNANAYANLTGSDALNPPGDYRADLTSAFAFDRVYDTAQDPQTAPEQIKASVTQLFYMNNFLHDWYYDDGFNEPARNAQTDNYGRGGNQNDEIQAQAQDVSGTDNANMSTPADGGKPRMRMFVFSGGGGARVSYSGALSGTNEVGSASFGPGNFDVSGEIVRPDPLDACATLTNPADVAGRIVLIDRGSCDFNAKARTVETAGAVGVIIANVATSANPDDAPGMAASTPPIPVAIGTLSVNFPDGEVLRAAVAGGAVSAHLERASGIRRDGTLDNGVIAHEWGHYISNRLVGNGNGLNTNQAGGMGEGFGDIHAMLLQVRAEDAALATTPDFTGAYSTAGYVSSTFVTLPGQIDNGYYYGLRRYPYSIDQSKNPLTYRHIVNGNPLPTTPPPAFGASGGGNSEVHATGEVWASMLWGCYASLLRDSDRLTFNEAQDRMKRYLVAGYKLTPNAPTFITARDAILSAIQSQSEEDYALCAAAFARRGLGSAAVAGSPSNNAGAEESYAGFGDVIFQDNLDNF